MPEDFGYVGSHGTTRSGAQLFHSADIPETLGRAGRGVYAWAKSEFYIELANAWYRKRYRSGDYTRHADADGVVLILGYNLTNGELGINLTDPAYQDRLYKLVNSLPGVNIHDDFMVGKVSDFLLNGLERELGETVSVVQFMTDHPKEAFMDSKVLPKGRWPRLIWPKVWAFCYRFPERVVVCSEVEVPELLQGGIYG